MLADWNSFMEKMDEDYPRFSVLSLWRRYCARILGLQLFSALSKIVSGSDRVARLGNDPPVSLRPDLLPEALFLPSAETINFQDGPSMKKGTSQMERGHDSEWPRPDRFRSGRLLTCKRRQCATPGGTHLKVGSLIAWIGVSPGDS
jgi:hypothetical protein